MTARTVLSTRANITSMSDSPDTRISPIGRTVAEDIAQRRAEDPEYRRLDDYYRPMMDLATAVILRRGALGAERMLMLTDVPGVLNEKKELIAEMTVGEVRAGIANGMISGGMIPKLETATDAVDAGVRASVRARARAGVPSF